MNNLYDCLKFQTSDSYKNHMLQAQNLGKNAIDLIKQYISRKKLQSGQTTSII